MSFEFVGLNLTGFLFLSVYSTVGYFNPDLLKGTFEIQDLCFAYNAVLATIVTIA
jgi:cystinosin